MLLPLPANDCKLQDDNGIVEQGNLIVYRIGSFDDMMKELTFLVYGRSECYFCHKKFVAQKDINDDSCFLIYQVTFDHLNPQEFGGPTLPNNMRACCSICNSAKGNYYEDEFAVLRSFRPGDEKKRIRFEEYIKQKQAKRRKGIIPSLPKGWITQEDPSQYTSIFSLSQHHGNSYNKQRGFFEQYGRLPKPIIVSSNGYVLKGFSTIALAHEYGIEKVDTITLENAICVERAEGF